MVSSVNGTVDSRLQVTLLAFDQYDNTATSYNNTVILNSSPTINGSGTVVIASGRADVDLYSRTVTTYTLSLTGSTLNTSSVATALFGSGVPRSVVIQDPRDSFANTTIEVTIRAFDQYGNLAVTEGRTVTLVLSGSAVGGGVVSFVNGVAKKNITNAVVQTVALSLIDSAIPFP